MGPLVLFDSGCWAWDLGFARTSTCLTLILPLSDLRFEEVLAGGVLVRSDFVHVSLCPYYQLGFESGAVESWTPQLPTKSKG